MAAEASEFFITLTLQINAWNRQGRRRDRGWGEKLTHRLSALFAQSYKNKPGQGSHVNS
jgi:hypothetical protein